MPEMELSSISEYLGGEGVWPRIWGYMLWPNEESCRRSFVASVYAHALACINEIPNQLHDGLGHECFEVVREKVSCDLLHNFDERGGGWSALLPALNKDIEVSKRIAALRTVGLVLDIIRSIPDGGSLNKAVHIIGYSARRLAMKASGRTEIRAAWQHYKSVAHLAVALCAIVEEPETDEGMELTKFLAIARDYQRFATTYRVPGHNTPLINPAQVWMVGENLSLPDPPPQLPLPDFMLAALATYRAPQ
jgi:hypothetical protein